MDYFSINFGFLYVGGTYEDNLGIFKRTFFLFAVFVNIDIISFIPYLINAWKALTYYLIALTVLSLVISLNFICLLMNISDGSPIEDQRDISSSHPRSM